MLTASYAKINLFLEVIEKLPSGFHKVNTVLCSIDLFDSIRFVLTNTGQINLWSSDPDIMNADNLICKIARHLQETYKVTKGIDVYLDKQIPIAAGLGGGSSNAAATIQALNQIWNLNLSESKKHDIASGFGSDINFFLEGGCSLGSNRGELITPMQDVQLCNILLVNPGIKIPASVAYGAVELPAQGETKQYDPDDPIATAYNRLERGIRKLYPPVDELLKGLNADGAIVSMLSGSGSTCIGFFEDEVKLVDCLKRHQELGNWTQRVRTISRSEYKNVLKTETYNR